jgi:hypothetical protein
MPSHRQGQEKKEELSGEVLTGLPVPRYHLFWVCVGVSLVTRRKRYQAKGPQHRQAPLLGHTQLRQAHSDNDAVKDIPLLLEVIVGVKGNDFEDHFSSKKCGKDLWTETHFHHSRVLGGESMMKQQPKNILFTKQHILPGLVAHACNSSIWEAEAGGLKVQGQPGLHSKSLSQQIKINKNRRSSSLFFASLLYCLGALENCGWEQSVWKNRTSELQGLGIETHTSGSLLGGGRGVLIVRITITT